MLVFFLVLSLLVNVVAGFLLYRAAKHLMKTEDKMNKISDFITDKHKGDFVSGGQRCFPVQELHSPHFGTGRREEQIVQFNACFIPRYYGIKKMIIEKISID